MKPLLCEHICILRQNTSEVAFYHSSTGLITTYAVDAHGDKAIRAADGKSDVTAIHDAIQPTPYTPQDIATFFRTLAQNGFYRDATNDARLEFPAHYEERLSRQLPYLSSLAPDGVTARQMQEKLLNKRVMIVGIGGAGSHLAVQLAAIGVGDLILIDPDHVERKNLGRQIYYARHIGKLKTSSLQQVIYELAPETKVTTYNYRLEDNAPWLNTLIPRADLVINCADYPSMDDTTNWLYAYTLRHRIPLIPAGGYNEHITSIPPTLVPGRSTCWYCIDHARRKTHGGREASLQLANVPCGVLLPAVSAMASIQIMEILRLFTEFEPLHFMGLLPIEWVNLRVLPG